MKVPDRSEIPDGSRTVSTIDKARISIERKTGLPASVKAVPWDRDSPISRKWDAEKPPDARHYIGLTTVRVDHEEPAASIGGISAPLIDGKLMPLSKMHSRT